ncbi:MAG TPA: hypothetical protein DIU07_09320 [Rhodobacteraceae bacterium]|nr:hypothetical protein [Paracoccaceae bacterium]
MRLLTASAFAACVVVPPAFAGTTCNFNIECYMTEPCEGSGWELTVDMDAGTLSTIFGDLEVLHIEAGPAPQVSARGDGALYLLTIGKEISFLTTHIAADPATITYVGECFTE